MTNIGNKVIAIATYVHIYIRVYYKMMYENTYYKLAHCIATIYVVTAQVMEQHRKDSHS